MKKRFLETAARGLIRLAAATAPPARRAEMRDEWNAEVARDLGRDGGWRTVVSAAGAFADARALRQLDRMHERKGGTGMRTTLEAWIDDARLALRSLARSPGFTVVSVCTLAIGLGSSAAIFTLLDRIVLDPLPYPAADRLVRLENQVPGVGPDEVWALSTAQLVFLSDRSETLEAVGIYRGEGGNVMTPAGPERARSARITASVLPLLGAEAQLGRLITGDDDRPEAPRVMLLSDGFWRRSWGADPDVIGQVLSYDGSPVEIIGVLSPDLELPGWPADAAPDLWLPMRIDRSGTFWNSHVFAGVARLAPGETPATAEAELQRLRARLPETFPNAYSQQFFDRYGFRTTATPLRDDVLGSVATQLWLLFAGVGLVLLVAGANVANLFLVRTESKRRELALRRVLGANGATIARHVLSEALTLAMAGGVGGLALALWVSPLLVRLAPAGLPRLDDVGVGWNTVLFTLMLAVVAGLLIAIYPLVDPAGRRPGPALAGGRTTSSGPPRQRLRAALVVTQMALAMTLLVGAGLLVDSLATLRAADPGFDPSGVVAMELHASPDRYPDDVALWGFHREVLARVRALPGVAEAGMGEEVPVSGGYGCTVQGFADETVYQRVEEAGMTTCAGQEWVTPGYFETLGIPLLEGRLLEAGDNDDPERAAVVVSRAFADRFWPGESALGKGVGPSGRTEPPFYRVVGVVDDVAKRSDQGQAPLSQAAMAIYYPGVYNPVDRGNWGGWWPGTMTLVVRTESTDPTGLIPAIRRVVADIDPQVPVANARPMEEVVSQATADVSFLSLLMIVSAASALLLAAVGLYGVVSYVVSCRTREIGMRLAIGAEPRSVVRAVVGRTVGLAALGLAVGLPLAYLTASAARSAIVGAEAAGPATYLAAAASIALVSLLASWIPARRAASIDPATSLRAD